MQVRREEVHLNSSLASINQNQPFLSVYELLTTVSAQGTSHCVDLMPLFTKIATLLVRACAKLFMVTKVYTLGSGTLRYTIGHVLAVSCSDSG